MEEAATNVVENSRMLVQHQSKNYYHYFDLYVYSRAVLFLLQEQPHIFDSRFCTLPVGATSDRNVVNQF